ncbi:hypothetical protein [Ruegeria lacuscaerulensis]|uniref:hypothetical protein n=1 Tax=Ruegeria lacuscaerulensis TaxID=55218 RepID=UPI00147EE7BF|nr:hypothetical protein [Ruegeria lacuscaerulensis]
MNTQRERCPVCQRAADRGRSGGRDSRLYDCDKCGQFEISGTAAVLLPGRLEDAGSMGQARLSHAIHQLQRYEAWPLIMTEHLDNLINARLPPVDEQLSNLVRWMLDQVEDDFLAPIEIPDYERLATIVGARDGERVHDLLNYAVKSGLIRWVPDTCFALTVEGSRSMKELMTDDLTLVKSDGEVTKTSIKGRVTNGTLVTFDDSLPIEPGDLFLRRLPSGLEEQFVVDDPGYQAAAMGIDAHFQAKVHRKDAPAQSLNSIVNNFHGPNSRVNIDSTDNSVNVYHQNIQTQIYNDLRERLSDLDADATTIEAIRTSIDEMESAHGTPSFKDKYTSFMSTASDHVGVFGPLLATLAGFL